MARLPIALLTCLYAAGALAGPASAAPGRVIVPLRDRVVGDHPLPRGFTAGVLRPDGVALVVAPGSDGRVRLAAVRPDGQVEAVRDVPVERLAGAAPAQLLRRPDGRLVLAVAVGVPEEPYGSRVALLGLTAQGDVDPAFHGGTPLVTALRPSGRPAALAPDGSVVVSGETGPATTDGARWALSRATPAGELDLSLGSAGVLELSDQPSLGVAVDVNPSGAIDAIGQVGPPVSRTRSLRRLRPDGTPDPIWAGGAPVGLSYGGTGGVLERPDGGLDVVTGGERSYLNRLRADGTPDPAFGQDGGVELPAAVGRSVLQPDGTTSALLAAPDGGAVVVLSAQTAGLAPTQEVIRVSADGRLTSDERTAPAFGGGFQLTDYGSDAIGTLDQTVAVLRPVALRPDGALLLAGGAGAGEISHYGDGGLTQDGALAVLGPNGRVDPSFGASVTDPPTVAVALPARPVLPATTAGAPARVRATVAPTGLGLLHVSARLAGRTVAEQVQAVTADAPRTLRLVVSPAGRRVLRRHPRGTLEVRATYRDLLGQQGRRTARRRLQRK